MRDKTVKTKMLRDPYRLYPVLMRLWSKRAYIGVICLLGGLAACKQDKNPENNTPLFESVPADSTGIHFANRVTDSREMNILNYHNFYNGGGVAIGDIDHDGKPDIFLTANQGENKLYRNLGNMHFQDITAGAKISSTHHWHTGVTMADVNGDGWLDIYVCNAGTIPGDNRANELYINQQDGTFREEAHAYGLDDTGASTQAVFFDYDHDGDLDCFVLNNSPKSIDNFGYTSSARLVRDPVNGDRLYRNDGGKFTDVSASAGIYGSEIAFGLGVVAADLNNDGWEDLYVANDFFEHDYLYINQHNGSFKEMANTAIGHMSNGAMGTDIADLNNDGYLDIYTAEMLPEDDYRLKTTLKFDGYDVQNARNQLDFHHQFTCNTLQLNNQDGTFSEVGQLCGVEATGWSWSALGFDFDNDGWKDLFICNGIRRDLTDQDFLAYFNSQETLMKIRAGGFDFMDLLNRMPSVPIPNYAFKNEGGLKFKNMAASLGLAKPGFSSGAAYADLDGDGDLDLVINNENDLVSVYRNKTTENLGHHFLKCQLQGNAPNTYGIGARVTVYTQGRQQMQEEMPTRGFQSSMDPVLVFGLNQSKKVDSVLVQWPDEKMQVLYPASTDTLLVLHQRDATRKLIPQKPGPTLFTELGARLLAGNTRHRENDYVDFDAERLLPKLLSTEGPKIATGDVNGDGLEDFIVGGASGDTTKLFLQQQDGHFREQPEKAFMGDAFYEDIGLAFLDADGDGDLDLVIASGGNQAKLGSPLLAPRLYLNDGHGHFQSAVTGWPTLSLNASCVRVGDYNGDGKPDIFIGARDVPGVYGMAPRSVLLENMGGAQFRDVTETQAPILKEIGMVTDAQWADINGDNRPELVVVGDWMPVTVLGYRNNRLEKISEVPHSSGWWNCLRIADLDGNGTPDLLAGNFGQNSNIRFDPAHPGRLYVDDFDNNGQVECVPVYYKRDGKAYPYYLKDEMEMQLPVLKKKFLRYDSYAGKTIDEIFSKEQLAHARVLTAEQEQSAVFYNDGKGNFQMEALPIQAQFSPVFGIVVTDLDGDGKNDIFLAGNFYGLKPQTGRMDAGYGTSLISTGNRSYSYLLPKISGLFLKGELRDLSLLKLADGSTGLLAAMNNDRICLFKKNGSVKLK
ncbi:MAG TPA: VCBS repeat-containing protein [Sediminibacterium sp.]|nr:VCBS repeat-containing protein [Sediminibacterium sp.]